MSEFPPATKRKVEVLLVKESLSGFPLVAVFQRSASNGDRWNALPGGKYGESGNEGECHIKGAIREIDEEIGVSLEEKHISLTFTDKLRHPKTPTTETCFVVAHCPANQEPYNVIPKENGALMFVRPDKAAEMLGDRATPEVKYYLNILALERR